MARSTAKQPRGSSNRIQLVREKDGDVQHVATEAQAVSLEFSGYTRVVENAKGSSAADPHVPDPK